MVGYEHRFINIGTKTLPVKEQQQKHAGCIFFYFLTPHK